MTAAVGATSEERTTTHRNQKLKKNALKKRLVRKKIPFIFVAERNLWEFQKWHETPGKWRWIEAEIITK